MIPRRLAAARPLVNAALRSPAPRAASTLSEMTKNMNAPYDGRNLDTSTDPSMNGGFVNPPAIKRSLRDPYGDWWDKQERRNFGEPVHEDNDVLGVFSTEPYTHARPLKAFLSFGTFVLTTLGVCGVVYMYYPDKPSTARTFPDGLAAELGGPTALPARKHGEADQFYPESTVTGETHALNNGQDSIVPLAIQKMVPEAVERVLPDSIHNTSDLAKSTGLGETHAAKDGEDSIVPKALQKIVPEKVERALPNKIHNTKD